MSPLGTVSRLLPKHLELPTEKKIDIITKQGRPPFGVGQSLTTPRYLSLAVRATGLGLLL